MSTWLINGQSPEHWGLTVVGGTFRSGRASTVQLRCTQDFDAAEKFAFNTAITITRDGSPFFKGKCRQIPKSASGASEGHDYLVEDVWAELERLTYQEAWAIRQSDYTGVAYSPTVVLGMNAAGTRINVGQQIAEVLAFAAGQGLSLQVGTMPTGMTLWPTEVNGMSCADVIRDCLKYYPDWIPWIDHSTTLPTVQVTPRASAVTVSAAVTSCTDFSISKTHDRVPAGVRIVYLTAGKIDDEVYRTMTIDQFPTVPVEQLVLPAGPGILVTTVELAGMSVQVQKQQVQTRTLPTSSSGAKAYLKKKFPLVKDLADSDWNITEWTTAVIPDDDDEVDPIDSKLERIPGGDRSDLPRELVRGAVTEWMQKKVGRVLVEFAVEASGSASEEERAKIEKLPPSFTVTATNAVTKIYKGVSSYTAGESAPVGIAQAFYESLVSGCYFEGGLTLQGEEISSVSAMHGGVLNVTGGVSEWATMKAPIHAVSWDLARGETAVEFGPNPEYSVQDFLEFLRLLNKRPNNEYTVAERSGNQIGDDAGISARGDSVGAYDTPETVTIGGGGGGSSFSHPFRLTTSVVEGAPKYQISKGSIVDGTNGTAESIDSLLEVDHTASAGFVVLEGAVSAGEVTGWTVAVVAEADAKEVVMNSATPPVQTKVRLVLGKLTIEESVATAWQGWFTSARLVMGNLNGSEAIMIESAPTHPTKI